MSQGKDPFRCGSPNPEPLAEDRAGRRYLCMQLWLLGKVEYQWPSVLEVNEWMTATVRVLLIVVILTHPGA